MSTATEISTAALKRIRVVGSGETPAAADVSDATAALSAMISGFESQGLSGDVTPFDSRFESAIIAMLAERLAEDYGKQVGPVLSRDAAAGWSAIRAAFTAVPRSRFDNGLAYTGNSTDIGMIIGQQTDMFSDWQASTDYELRVYVLNEGNIYECITAGTSAASGGPTTTDEDITDGTVHWCWRRVDGG